MDDGRRAEGAGAINAGGARPPAEVISMLIEDVEAGLRVYRERDGIPLTDEQISERARNLVGALVGNYEIRAHTGAAPAPDSEQGGRR